MAQVGLQPWAELSFQEIAHDQTTSYDIRTDITIWEFKLPEILMSDVWERSLAHMLCKIELKNKVWLAQIPLVVLGVPSALVHEDLTP